MRILYILFISLIVFSNFAAAQDRTDQPIEIGDPALFEEGEPVQLTGTVTELETGEPLQGVTVHIEETGQGTVTDENGTYQLIIQPGEYFIEFRFLGMEEIKKHVIIHSSGELDIALTPADLDLDEIIVEEMRFGNRVSRTATGVETATITDLEQLPVLMGEVDVVQSLMSLPGVQTVGEGASGYNVRGGRTDQNLVLMDGAPVFNSSHVLGLFSVFNPDVTEGYALYKGHMPERFGGRLSSVLDVGMRQGSKQEFKVSGGVGLYTGRLMAEGPIINDRTSFLLAGRGAYAGWVLWLAGADRDLTRVGLPQDIFDSNAWFYDVNANLSHRISSNHRFSLKAYSSDDLFLFSDNFGYSWSNRLASLTLNSILGDHFVSRFSAAIYNYKSAHFDPSVIDAFRLDNGIGYYRLKEDLLYTGIDRHTINAGIEWTRYHSDDESIRPYDDQSPVRFKRVEKDHGDELAFYLGNEFELLSGMLMSAGVRYSRYYQIGPARVFTYREEIARSNTTFTDTTRYNPGKKIVSYSGLEPRLSARVSIGQSASIKMSYNRTRQYIHQISNNISPTPADIWQPSTTHLPPQFSDSYTIGWYQNFRDQWEASAEVYYREIGNLVEYIDFAELFMNEHIETDLLSGEGRAYGGEITLRKNTGKWTGWLSYAFGRTFVSVGSEFEDQQINQGEWFPSNYDQPHTINMVGHRRLGERSAFSFNFAYRTGRPVTALTSNYLEGNTTIPVWSQRNEYRIPDYIRLDISFTIAENIWKNREVDPERRLSDNLNITFYNILGRKNAFSVFYQRPDQANVPDAFKLSVLGAMIPSITYNFSF